MFDSPRWDVVTCKKFPGMKLKPIFARTRAELNKEYLKSEKRRVLIIIVLFVFSISVIPVLHGIFSELVDNEMNQKQMLGKLALSMLLFFVFELSVYFRLLYMQNKKILLPRFVPYINTFVELTIPILIIISAVQYDYSILSLEYNGYIFYIVLIILSSLHLEQNVSIMAGIVAAICYGFLTRWAVGYLEITENIPQFMEMSGARIFSLALFGVLSGLVAREMNKKLHRAIEFQKQQKQVEVLLGQQVSKEIADELINNNDELSTRIIDAAIMFMDIKDFSTWADTKTPEEVIHYQNQVFNPIIDIVNKRHGVINQFLGDGFMASFGIGSNDQKYVQHAFQAGVEITRKIREMEEPSLIPETFVRIGLHRGKIIVGNIGNDIRKQFSLAGKNIIIAARLEQMNKELDSQYLISEDIERKIKPDGFCLEEVGMIKLRGIDKEVKAYQVIC